MAVGSGVGVGVSVGGGGVGVSVTIGVEVATIVCGAGAEQAVKVNIKQASTRGFAVTRCSNDLANLIGMDYTGRAQTVNVYMT